MDRIFVTGDTHGFNDVKKLDKMPDFLNKNDILFILGDSGICWDGGTHDNLMSLYYNDKNYTTVSIIGNHENHNLISKLPIVKKFGGKLRKVNDRTFYIENGEILNINNRTFLCIGGADSIDKHLRTESINWWSEETISNKDIIKARNNLEKYNNKIDYVLSHTGGIHIVSSLCFNPTKSDFKLTELLESIKYKHHYCGHYHFDKVISSKERIVYDDLLELYFN